MFFLCSGGSRYDSVFYDNCTKGPSSVKSLGGKNIFPPPLPHPLPLPFLPPPPLSPSHTVHHTSLLTSLYRLQDLICTAHPLCFPLLLHSGRSWNANVCHKIEFNLSQLMDQIIIWFYNGSMIKKWKAIKNCNIFCHVLNNIGFPMKEKLIQ